jgi:hypothetical protein
MTSNSNDATKEPVDGSLVSALTHMGWRLPRTVDETADAERWVSKQQVELPAELRENSIAALARAKSGGESRTPPERIADDRMRIQEQDRDHGRER